MTRIDDTFRFHEAVLGLRAKRQQVLASNIANADTPNYKARDVDFNAVLGGMLAQRSQAVTLTSTAPRHIAGNGMGQVSLQNLQYRQPLQASVDGNTVEMDIERAQFADNTLRYETSLTLLGMEIKKILAAIQG